MEDSREFQTNNQDENKVVSHGTRNTSVEDVDFRPTEVVSIMAGKERGAGNQLNVGNDGNGQIQPGNRSVNAVHPPPKPSSGDDLSSEEDRTAENDLIFKERKTGQAIDSSCASGNDGRRGVQSGNCSANTARGGGHDGGRVNGDTDGENNDRGGAESSGEADKRDDKEDFERGVDDQSGNEDSVYPSPKPSTGDDLSSEEYGTPEVSLTPENGQVFKRGKTEHTIQGSCAKPPVAKVPEEGLSQTSAEEPNKAMSSSSAKPSTSEEESDEEFEKGTSLRNQRLPYKIPPLQCVTCYNVVNIAIRILHKGPSSFFLLGCFCTILIQWGPFCESCGESFPALLLRDILSQNVNKKGCERLDGREEGTVMDRGEFLGQVAAGVRDGRDEGGGQGGSKVDKQQRHNIRLAIQSEFDVSTLDSFAFIMYSVGVSEPPGPPNIARCIPLKSHGEGLLNVRQDFLRIIWKKAKIHTEDLRRKWFRM